jgi:hypothetical protein
VGHGSSSAVLTEPESCRSAPARRPPAQVRSTGSLQRAWKGPGRRAGTAGWNRRPDLHRSARAGSGKRRMQSRSREQGRRGGDIGLIMEPAWIIPPLHAYHRTVTNPRINRCGSSRNAKWISSSIYLIPARPESMGAWFEYRFDNPIHYLGVKYVHKGRSQH